MWGCFLNALAVTDSVAVFPMHVGVFLRLLAQVRLKGRLPHACGGVSTTMPTQIYGASSSPCMWGCFHPADFRLVEIAVFPMHVGVFPTCRASQTAQGSLPHACGGVSKKPLKGLGPIKSSPCMWGCFPAKRERQLLQVVFPMHVGVFLTSCVGLSPPESLPHARMET